MSTKFLHRCAWPALAAGLLLLAVALLAGCGLSLSPTAAVVPTATVPALAPQPAVEPTGLPATSPAPPGAASGITLTLWTTEALSPTVAITAGQIVAQEVAAFEADHDEVRVEFVLKKPYGKGGVLDYLLTTAAVVPALLPDLAFIDVDELPAAVQGELLQPLDELFPSSLTADLYPFAREATTFDGRLMGVQVQADLDFLVYDSGQLTVPPRSWPGVLSSTGTYLFPAGGQAGLVNDDFLIQYLAVHPWSVAGGAEPFLEVESLTAVLQFYQDGVTRGIFPASIAGHHSNEECWADYLDGQATMTHVAARLYRAERQRLPSSAVAPIPAINGAGSAIGRGWALVLVSADPARQVLAADLLVRLMAAETNAAWNQAAGTLPTRQSILAGADELDIYGRFVHQQLLAAQPRPRLANYAQVASALQTAVEAVVDGSATPEEAAAQALESSR